MEFASRPQGERKSSHPGRDGVARPKILKSSAAAKAVLQALSLYWYWMLLLGSALGAGAASAVWLKLPVPKVTASSVLELSSQIPSVVAPSGDNREFNSFRQLQSNLIKHRRVLGGALERPELRNLPLIQKTSDPVAYLEDAVKIDFKLGIEYLRISVDGDREEEAVALVNAVTQSYLHEVVYKERDRRSERLSRLQELLAAFSKKLAEKHAKLEALAAVGGSSNDKVVALRQELAQQNLNTAHKELAEIHSEIRRWSINAESEPAKPDSISAVPKALVDAETEKDPQIAADRIRIQSLEREIASYKEVIQPGAVSPRLTQLEEELATRKASLQKMIQSGHENAASKIRQDMQRLRAEDSKSAKLKLESAKRLEAELMREIETLTIGTKKLGVAQGEIELIKRDLGLIQKSADALAAHIDSLQIEKEAPPRVTLFSDTLVTRHSDGPKRLRYSAIAGLIGFIAGSAPFLLLEMRRRRIDQTEEITEGLGLTVVGTLPYVKRSARVRRNERSITQNAMLNESVDSMRAAVLHAFQRDRLRTLMITSAVAGEGKTSLSGYVSLSLARAGQRTLLIDGDMRRPAIHRAFSLEKAPGLAEYLLGSHAIDDCLRSTHAPNLVVMPSGTWSSAAVAALTSDKWPVLIDEMKSIFDVVVVDTPPVLIVTDALVLGQKLDVAVLSVMRNVSELDLLYDAYARLQGVGIPAMGVAMSGASSRLYTNRYYRRYAGT
jgi:capsular exopolysaccharide synthesis family protein